MFEKEITKGIEFLNKINPGWVDKINLETLNLSSGTDCIIGQLYGDYSSHMSILEEQYSIDRFDYGFSCVSSEISTKEWKERIKNLQMASSGKLKLNTSNILDSITEKFYSKEEVKSLLEDVMSLGMTLYKEQIKNNTKRTGREVLEEFIKNNL